MKIAVTGSNAYKRVPRRIRHLALSLVLFALYGLIFFHQDAYFRPHSVDAIVVAKAPVAKQADGTPSYSLVTRLPDGTERDVELNNAAAYAATAVGSTFHIALSDASLGRQVSSTALLQRIVQKLLMFGGMFFLFRAIRNR